MSLAVFYGRGRKSNEFFKVFILGSLGKVVQNLFVLLIKLNVICHLLANGVAELVIGGYLKTIENKNA